MQLNIDITYQYFSEEKMKYKIDYKSFVRESNKIEEIHREPNDKEIKALEKFAGLEKITVADIEEFVKHNQEGAVLRREKGMDVSIGSFNPIPGGINIEIFLKKILEDAVYPNYIHIHTLYEKLHPFTDCNGRSGRALWLWQMNQQGEWPGLGFLHTYYYQTLR